ITSSTTTTLACDPVTSVRARLAAQCHCDQAANHGAYVRCVAHAVKAEGLPKSSARIIKKCAAKSTCGKQGFVTCCRTNAKGVTKCSTKHDAAKCKKPKGGSARVGTQASCCDACSETGCSLPEVAR